MDKFRNAVAGFGRKCLCLAFCLLVLSGLGLAQTGRTQISTSTVQAGQSVYLINSAITYHQITWYITGGTVATCSVRVDSSTDGVTWSAGGVITAQTCTSAGQSTVANVIANYLRINVTTITGGGTINVVWIGYNIDPSLGAGCNPGAGGTDPLLYNDSGVCANVPNSVVDPSTGDVTLGTLPGGYPVTKLGVYSADGLFLQDTSAIGMYLIELGSVPISLQAPSIAISAPGSPGSLTTGLSVIGTVDPAADPNAIAVFISNTEISDGSRKFSTGAFAQGNMSGTNVGALSSIFGLVAQANISASGGTPQESFGVYIDGDNRTIAPVLGGGLHILNQNTSGFPGTTANAAVLIEDQTANSGVYAIKTELGPVSFGDGVLTGVLTLSEGSAFGDGYQFNCQDCDTPLVEGATCTTGGDGAGAAAFNVRG